MQPSTNLYQPQPKYYDSETKTEYREVYVGCYEGYPLKMPYKTLIPVKKSLDQRISDYLDKSGVLTEQMRKDITAMIREEENE